MARWNLIRQKEDKEHSNTDGSVDMTRVYFEMRVLEVQKVESRVKSNLKSESVRRLYDVEVVSKYE
jgi:hypothetical protein